MKRWRMERYGRARRAAPRAVPRRPGARRLALSLALAVAGLGQQACRRGGPGVAGSTAPPAVVPADAAAAAEPRLVRRERRCMGTLCSVVAYASDEGRVDRAAQAAFDEMDRLEALMTTWRETSDVSRVNAAAGKEAVAVAPETFEVVEKALWIAEKTGGAFDITMGVFAGLWRFDEDNDGALPTPRQVRERLRLVGWKDVTLDRTARTIRLARAGQKINLGGIAKGYVVDAAVRVLREAGLRDFLVQAGGDLYAAGRRGDRDWTVGIQDPRAPKELPKSGATSFAVLSLSDAAFNTSGDYERYILAGGRRYHHILDPRTGYPVGHTRAVTVLAPTAFLADTVDTAILILGAKAGMRLVESLRDEGVEAVIVDARNQVHVSPGLRDRLRVLRPPTDGV
jgi:thiamine biosynthesis lipoprotein